MCKVIWENTRQFVTNYLCGPFMIRIGKIVATHGLNGAVIMTHVAGRKNWLKKGDPLFVALRRDSHIPFFVTQVKSAGNEEMVVLLEDTESVEAAKKLIGKEVFVKEDILAQGGAADNPLLWIGFEMEDEEAGRIGLIKDIFQTPTQWLAEVDHQGKEVLVPLIAPVWKKTDIHKKVVFVALPAGLLEVYL